MAAKEAVHPCLEGTKARQIPKHLKGIQMPELCWKEGRVMNETELKHFVAVLREEGPGNHDPTLRTIAPELDAAQARAWSHTLLKSWEQLDYPSTHKWMLCQYRVFASDEDMEALCRAHDWNELATQGKWARANWYLSLIGERVPSPGSTRLFFDLLSAGKLDGTVQKAARHTVEAFAAHEGMSPQDFLEAAELIGVFPDRALPFVPGEQRVTTTEGQVYVVNVNLGELSFEQVDTHKHLMEVPETLTPEDAALVAEWQHIVHEGVLRWGGYLHYSMTLGRTFPFETIQQKWFVNPVARGVLSSLLWRTPKSKVVRLEQDGAFDVNYDAVELEPGMELEVVQLTSLDELERKAWYVHLSDNEMLLPFDVLQRDMYVERIHALLAEDYVEVEEYRDAIDSLYDYGYLSGLTNDNGCVFESYKTFPEFNARVFLGHTGFEVVEGHRFQRPSNVISVHFQDLFGQERSMDEIYISVLAETVVDLMKIKHLPAS